MYVHGIAEVLSKEPSEHSREWKLFEARGFEGLFMYWGLGVVQSRIDGKLPIPRPIVPCALDTDSGPGDAPVDRSDLVEAMGRLFDQIEAVTRSSEHRRWNEWPRTEAFYGPGEVALFAEDDVLRGGGFANLCFYLGMRHARKGFDPPDTPAERPKPPPDNWTPPTPEEVEELLRRGDIGRQA